MRGELPNQLHTTCNGNSRCSSVCLLARIEWNNRGNPRRRRGEAVASSRCVGWRSSNPSPCWPRRGTAVRQPRIRFCHRRSRTLHRGWVSVQGSKTVIQLGGCFPSKTHKDLTSMSAGRFIRSNWIVACPISVSPTMRVPLTDQSKCSSQRSLCG